MAMDGHGCIYELDMAWSTTTFAFFLVWLDMAASMAMAEVDITGLVKTHSIPGGIQPLAMAGHGWSSEDAFHSRTEPTPGYGWTWLGQWPSNLLVACFPFIKVQVHGYGWTWLRPWLCMSCTLSVL